jgi:hypothetical protein
LNRSTDPPEPLLQFAAGEEREFLAASAVPLDPALGQALDRDGYLLLRGAFAGTADAVRAAFDAGMLANDQWPVPRGRGWIHALVDLDPDVQAVCRLPELLSAAHRVIGGRFFLAQVEGREPRPGAGFQDLHRDGFGDARAVSALAFIDDYGPGNGATRIAPGTHKAPHRSAEEIPADQVITLEGRAGDVLVFDADLLHGATRNLTGVRRRSLLIAYFAEALDAQHRATVGIRNIRMDLEYFG